MASLATDLQIPKVPLIVDQQRSDRHALLREIAKESWLARTDIGYSVLTYESVMGILRDKRWHRVPVVSWPWAVTVPRTRH